MGYKDERKYFAISIKHSEYRWKFGEPCVLWGCKRTDDNESRCFSGYTKDIHSAELYSINEFINKYGAEICNSYPVKMVRNLMEAYKKYDTVLMDKDVYETYYNMCIDG